MEVCQLATQFLEEACESVDILRLVVAMQPTLDHLGDVGHGLLLKWDHLKYPLLPFSELSTLGLCQLPLGSGTCSTRAISTVRWIFGFT